MNTVNITLIFVTKIEEYVYFTYILINWYLKKNELCILLSLNIQAITMLPQSNF